MAGRGVLDAGAKTISDALAFWLLLAGGVCCPGNDKVWRKGRLFAVDVLSLDFVSSKRRHSEHSDTYIWSAEERSGLWSNPMSRSLFLSSGFPQFPSL